MQSEQVTLRDRKRGEHPFTFMANQWCWNQLEQHTGKSIWTWLEEYAKSETVSQTHELLYALTATQRRLMPMGFPEFVDLIPDDPAEYESLRMLALRMISKSFIWPTLLKSCWMVVNLALEEQKRRLSLLIGSSENTSESNMESTPSDSGTTSTSPTSTESVPSKPTTTGRKKGK